MMSDEPIPYTLIDKSVSYKSTAGKCEKCGHFKTWEFKIMNKTTGKEMPAHINGEGFLIEGGECPWWIAQQRNKVKQAEQAAKQKEVEAPHGVQPSLGLKQVHVVRKNGKFALEIDGYPDLSVRLATDDLMRFIYIALKALYSE